MWSSKSKIESLTLKALASITPDDWKQRSEPRKRLEEEYGITDELFITNTADDSESSDSNSETNSESDNDDELV
uniref:Uncharacterized protein n=1 Tax=Heliothis virescens TaxID=7102 RepID=A0A2A4ITR1_HELVI